MHVRNQDLLTNKKKKKRVSNRRVGENRKIFGFFLAIWCSESDWNR